MKPSLMIGLVGLLAVLAAWFIILKGPGTPPFPITNMAGCYRPSSQGAKSKVSISSSGLFSYNGKTTSVSAYKDKEGLSLLPATEILAEPNGDLLFLEGQALILRIDKDGRGFVVPGKTDKAQSFRKVAC